MQGVPVAQGRVEEDELETSLNKNHADLRCQETEKLMAENDEAVPSLRGRQVGGQRGHQEYLGPGPVSGGGEGGDARSGRQNLGHEQRPVHGVEGVAHAVPSCPWRGEY